MRQLTTALACTWVATSVALGAFGQHALADVLTDKQLDTLSTAVSYLGFHGLGGLALMLAGWQRPALLVVVSSGLFSFALLLYLLTQTVWITFFAPIGGLGLIVGWLWAGWLAFRASNVTKSS